MYRWEITERLAAGRVIAIVRAADPERAATVASTLLDAQVPAVEVALTTPRALTVVDDLVRRASSRALIGAGTVLDAEAARLAIDAGAQFLVSPSLDRAVIEAAHRYGVACIPGVATATEVRTGLSWGADLLKVFPATALSPAWVAAIRSALPQAPLVPTGGVGVDDARAWIDAGAVAVAIGGALTSGALEEITGRAQRLLDALAR